MKKILAIALVMMIAAMGLTACSSKTITTQEATEAPTAAPMTATEAPTANPPAMETPAEVAATTEPMADATATA